MIFCVYVFFLLSSPNRFLNVHTPLYLGGVDPSYTIPRVTVPGGFDGCIKNLVSDGFTYDLARTGSSSNSESGCLRTDGRCTDDDGKPVCNNGVCEADLSGYVCICYPGYSGTTCTEGKCRKQNQSHGCWMRKLYLETKSSSINPTLTIVTRPDINW